MPQPGYVGGSAASPRLQQSRVQVHVSGRRRESLEQPRPMTPLKWQRLGTTRLWPTKMSNMPWWLYDINLSESMRILVVVGSTAIRQRASAKDTGSDTGSCGPTWFNNVQCVSTFTAHTHFEDDVRPSKPNIQVLPLEYMPTHAAYCLTLYYRFEDPIGVCHKLERNPNLCWFAFCGSTSTRNMARYC